MTKRRINIVIHDGIDPALAAQRVASAMAQGRISGDDKYYCWVSTFTDGVVVYTRGPSKRLVNSDSFVVYKETPRERRTEDTTAK